MRTARIMDLIRSFTLALLFLAVNASYPESILLRDVQVLTLHSGQMTAGRRSSPVPQLKCVGGSAGCSAYVPLVVQCYNRGSDGYDIQWECKADMDNAYRFGKIAVSCEGFAYPDDPYILKGSCGLEYHLELTKEGYQQQNGNQGHQSYQQPHGTQYGSSYKGGSTLGLLVTLCLVCALAYAFYHFCVASAHQRPDGYQAGPDPPGFRGPTAPPPPGFRSEYTQGGCSSTYNDGSASYPPPPYSATGTHMGGNNPLGGGGNNPLGGFWGGAGIGGMLGYLFGSRTNTHYQQPYHAPGNTWGGGMGGSNWGGGGGGWGSGFGSSGGGTSYRASSSSSGTRTTSGFGGTTRR